MNDLVQSALAIADELEAVVDVRFYLSELIRKDAISMLRSQHSELHKYHQLVFWLRENRPEVLEDMKKASRIDG